MELDINTFDKSNIIYEDTDVLFVAQAIADFFKIHKRKINRITSILIEPKEKTTRCVSYKGQKRRVTVLTLSGVDKVLDHVKRTDITNIDNIRVNFRDLYKKYLETVKNKIDEPLTGCKLIDCDPATIEGSCVYLFKITKDTYKFGETDKFKNRMNSHKREFNYEKLCSVFPCPNKTVSQRAEADIKELLNTHNYLIQYPKKNNAEKFHTEVFKCDDPEELIIKKFADIVSKRINEHMELADSFNNKLVDVYKYNLMDNIVVNENLETQKYINSQENIVPVLQQLIKEINDIKRENNELKVEVINLKNRVEFLENNSKTTEKINIVREYNRPSAKIDLPLDRIRLYVEKNIKPSLGKTLGKKLLEDRIKNSDLNEFIGIDAETTREFRTVLRGVIESTYNIDTKGVNKDMYYNCDLNFVTVDEFINQCCVINANGEEPVTNINNAYINYCNSIQKAYPENGLFPKMMNESGYKSHSGKSGYKYHGIYLKNNNVSPFVEHYCENGDVNTHYCSLSHFHQKYKTICVSDGLIDSQIYSKKAIKSIVANLGYELREFGKGCYNIHGIKIIGEEYNRKGHAKNRGVPKITNNGVELLLNV